MASLFLRRMAAAVSRVLPVIFAPKFRGMDELSIICMVRDEAPYLREWIEYHRLAGVSRFYLFDNESKDDIRRILQPYVDEGLVVYEYLSDEQIDKLRPKYKATGEKAQIAHWLGIKKCQSN
ncbi:MAG: glycosyltransferase family 92 protein, partial [Rickettsiales bacterium]|nr:glycosyltransferase family 92 protein [Rickettsiales bacterium]